MDSVPLDQHGQIDFELHTLNKSKEYYSMIYDYQLSIIYTDITVGNINTKAAHHKLSSATNDLELHCPYMPEKPCS